MGYMLTSQSKKKVSGEYSMNQNLTIDSVDVPKSAKPKCSMKSTKSGHKKADSLSSVSFSRPKIS